MNSRIIRETVLNLHGLKIKLRFKLVKNITLRIKETGDIFLTAPVGMSLSEVQQFLESREQWLRQKLQQVLQEKSQQKQEPKYSMGELPFDGQYVWLWGKRLPANFLLSGKSTVPMRCRLTLSALLPQRAERESQVRLCRIFL